MSDNYIVEKGDNEMVSKDLLELPQNGDNICLSSHTSRDSMAVTSEN